MQANECLKLKGEMKVIIGECDTPFMMVKWHHNPTDFAMPKQWRKSVHVGTRKMVNYAGAG